MSLASSPTSSPDSPPDFSYLLPDPKPLEHHTPLFAVDFTGDLQAKGQKWILPRHPDDPDTLGLILSKHYCTDLRINRRTQAIEYNSAFVDPDGYPSRTQTGWRACDTHWRSAVKLALGRDWLVEKIIRNQTTYKPWALGRDRLVEWLEMLATDRVEDDVAQFFARLRAASIWDGVPKIAHVLTDYLGAANTALNRWASANLFVGCVLATEDPGKRRRGVITLVGPQYSGKTTLLLSLLPSGLQRYCSSMSLHGDDKQRTEALLGQAVVELGELAGSSRTESEQLKSWLTRDADYVRLSYRRDPVRIPRQTLIVASINSGQELPRDPSGSTRWICVECPQSLNVEREITDEMRLQWWAEAVVVADQQGPGGPNVLARGWFERGIPHVLLEEQSQANKLHESQDETIANMLEVAELDIGDQFTAVDLAQLIGWLPRYENDGVTPLTAFKSRRQQLEFCGELRQQGWEKVHWKVGKNQSVKGWRKIK